MSKVLRHYSKRIRIAAIENGHIDKDTEDSIKSRLVAALFKFRFDGQATWQEVRFVGKIIMLTFNDTEEKAVEKAISKLPASKVLQTEIEQLTKEKNALYNEYREKKASVRELQTVKSNLDKILRREPERGKGRENER